MVDSYSFKVQQCGVDNSWFSPWISIWQLFLQYSSSAKEIREFLSFESSRPPETIARNLALAAQERSMDTTAKVRVLRATLGPDTQKAKTTNFLATRVSEGLGKTWSTCQNLPKIMAYLSVPWLGLLYVVGITNQMCILYVWSWMKLKTRLSIRSSQGPGLSF